MSDPIRPELTEKVTRALDWTVHEYRVDTPGMKPYCKCGWKADQAFDVNAFDRHLAEVALAAAADDLRAEGAAAALREAADAAAPCKDAKLGCTCHHIDLDDLRTRADQIARVNS